MSAWLEPEVAALVEKIAHLRAMLRKPNCDLMLMGKLATSAARNGSLV
jgi:hypothetical protein